MESLKEYWNIDPEAGMLLQALVYTQQPRHILEIGTSNGYSAILMGHIASQYRGEISTIEFFDERVLLAKENIQKEGLEKTIQVLRGDAMEILPRLISEQKKFELIFLDANKEEHASYFAHAMQMIEPNGLIIADNTISHAKKLTEFFTAVKQEPRAHALELSIGTGLMIVRVE